MKRKLAFCLVLAGIFLFDVSAQVLAKPIHVEGTDNDPFYEDDYDPIDHIKVNGKTVVVAQGRDEKTAYIVAVDGKPVIAQRYSRQMGLKSYRSGRHAYVVVELGGGGSMMCSAARQIIDLSDVKPLVSDAIDSCGHEKNYIKNGVFTSVAVLPREVVTITFFKGEIVKTSKEVRYDPAGPATVPNNDLATYVAKMRSEKMLRSAAAVNALKKILPDAEFSDVKYLIIDWPGKFTDHHSFVCTASCQPHQCKSHQMALAFDHQGHAYVSIYDEPFDQRRRITYDPVYLRFFGDPPKEIHDALDIVANQQNESSPTFPCQ